MRSRHRSAEGLDGGALSIWMSSSAGGLTRFFLKRLLGWREAAGDRQAATGSLQHIEDVRSVTTSTLRRLNVHQSASTSVHMQLVPMTAGSPPG